MSFQTANHRDNHETELFLGAVLGLEKPLDKKHDRSYNLRHEQRRRHTAAILEMRWRRPVSGFESLTIGSLAESAGCPRAGCSPISVARGTAGGCHRGRCGAVHQAVFLPALKARAGCRGCARCSTAGSTGPPAAACRTAARCRRQQEFDDRPGPVRDAVVEHFSARKGVGPRRQLAVDQGHLRAI